MRHYKSVEFLSNFLECQASLPKRKVRKVLYWRLSGEGSESAPNSATVLNLTETVYPVHINYKEEWWEHMPSNSHGHGERLWFNSADTDTNFWEGIKWLDGQ